MPRLLVIDTNVVLDWLVFGNPIAPMLDDVVVSGRWRWIATPAMREEFGHVIGRAALSRWSVDSAAVWARWDAHADMRTAPAAPGAHERLACTDPDDQIFIDLAIAARAAALLTRDRAVLRLAPRARRFGVAIATPERWLHASGQPSS